MYTKSQIRKVAFVGDYLPRKCGIATFTKDLFDAVVSQYPGVQTSVVAINDIEGAYVYPPEVRYEIQEQNVESYQQAADFLNISNVDLVCVQHEFGIYGGAAGSHLLALLRELNMPIVPIFHTVMDQPNSDQRRVMQELLQLATRSSVMTRRGQSLLEKIYQVPADQVELIPHGIPDMPFADPKSYKDQFGVEGKNVLLTFGLLSPNKGIEHVLNALPEILQEFPDTVYIIQGVTHPNLVRDHGEAYRLSLERLAKDNNVQKHVIFYNRFVELEVLKEFIAAADIYVTPYLNEAQVTSGTLAYSFGSGKVVVSTPYWHASELLADGRGVLVPFGDSKAIAHEVLALLRDEPRRLLMRKNAYIEGREMVWNNVAHRYMHCFERARTARSALSRKLFATKTLDQQLNELPDIKVDHFRQLTDSTGILQHSVFTVPNYAHGYCTDDNARALILTLLLEELGHAPNVVRQLATTYTAFLNYAFDPSTNRFRNFMGFDRKWLDEIGSEDCNGRALWALGACVGRSPVGSLQALAGQLFDAALPEVASYSSPRAWAFALLGIHEYLRRSSEDPQANRIRDLLTSQMMRAYQATAGADWPWFEDSLSYDNARLPHALILSGRWTGQPKVFETGLNSLQWLVEKQTTEAGYFQPIGSNGFYPRNGVRARFDQQPIEAQATVAACLEAFLSTKDDLWFSHAFRAFEWFLGRNDLGAPIYDSNSGGCRDGLHVDRVNQNQGAESTLAFLLSLTEMRLVKNMLTTFRKPVPRGE